jgi:putative flippase GtrA
MLKTMKLVDTVRDRWSVLSRELAKFGIIGVFNTVVDFAVWNALAFLGPIKAQVLATIVSATSSYFMNRHWTFRHRSRSGLRREYLLFFAFNAIGLAITAGILAVAAYGFGVDDRLTLNLVKAFGIVIATAFRFWSYRRWVFLHPEDALLDLEPPGPEPEPARGTEG